MTKQIILLAMAILTGARPARAQALKVYDAPAATSQVGDDELPGKPRPNPVALPPPPPPMPPAPEPPPPPPLSPADQTAHARTFAGAFLGAVVGGLAGLLIASHDIAEKNARNSDRPSGPGDAYEAMAFGAGGAVVGGVIGYIIARPVAAPPPAASTAWSELSARATAKLPSAPRDGRVVVPVLQLSF